MVAESRKIIHVDVDAFYAQVEQRDNPDLRGRPVAVDHGARRGVVTTASYETRPYGVHSALPSLRGIRLVGVTLSNFKEQHLDYAPQGDLMRAAEAAA
jgi:hypothetical protein